MNGITGAIATQQNTALVEQVAAARSLEERACTLKVTVSAFKLAKISITTPLLLQAPLCPRGNVSTDDSRRNQAFAFCTFE